MTVKELINHLQQFDSESKVMFSHVDHTDWNYKIEMTEHDVYTDDMLSDDYDDDEDYFDDEDNYIGPEVVVFSLSLD